ncbi:MAG: transporter substrate-binding domain-containing protein [Clostridia bacterium]|nr:transporter substrate-binding domain-containing protein [Clostridia bacterium]
MKKFLALVLAGIMCMGVASCGKKAVEENAGAESDLAYVTEKGKLVVGVTEYEPMDYMENGEWTGFDAEFAEEVAKLMGVDVEFVVIDWDNKFLELDSKSIDCIWNGMTITDEVNLNTSCSVPYAKNEQVVVMKKDIVDNYKDNESMKDLKFAVESGSAAESAAADLGFNTVAVKAQSDALMEVQAGSTDACIIDITMADSMTGEGTSYADLAKGLSLTKEEYGIGFRKGSDLKAAVDGYIKELKDNGKLGELSEKYSVSLAD